MNDGPRKKMPRRVTNALEETYAHGPPPRRSRYESPGLALSQGCRSEMPQAAPRAPKSKPSPFPTSRLLSPRFARDRHFARSDSVARDLSRNPSATPIPYGNDVSRYRDFTVVIDSQAQHEMCATEHQAALLRGLWIYAFRGAREIHQPHGRSASKHRQIPGQPRRRWPLLPGKQ